MNKKIKKSATAKIIKSKRQRLSGRVISKKSLKTAIVVIESLHLDPYYAKRYKRHRRIAAHDEKDAAKVNDLVEIEGCRPISKTKRWKIIEILK